MSRAVTGLLLVVALFALPAAQNNSIPSARLVPAPRVVLPHEVDSNVPMLWALVNGNWRFFAFASVNGVPSLLAGPEVNRLQVVSQSVTLNPHPGHGVWMEAVIADDQGTWYGYYHHEQPADECGRPNRAIASVGAARSNNRGRTWRDLGTIIEAPVESYGCPSNNDYVIGGVGDVSAMLDADKRDVYFFVSQYSNEPREQGVGVARLAWANRDRPAGRVEVWHDGAWLNARSYPFGTPLVAVREPWHDRDLDVDAFWGPAVHWNTYLEQYVMLLNRARNEAYDNEGIYVAYSRELGNPRAWSAPRKLMNGGGWYPQVAGLETGTGTDKMAGQRARFFLHGTSEFMIDFAR